MDSILKTFDLTRLDAKMIGAFMVLFFLFWQSIKKFVFAPFLGLIEEREDRTEGATSESFMVSEKAQKILQQYNSEIDSVRIAATRDKEEKVQQAGKSASEMIKHAEGRLAIESANLRQEQALREQRERDALSHHSEDLAKSAAEKMLAGSIFS